MAGMSRAITLQRRAGRARLFRYADIAPDEHRVKGTPFILGFCTPMLASSV